jgi:uncharacterized protein (DUF1697 family)
MPTFIAMLRGINVSGHKIIKMEPLRACFIAMDFSQVKTYVQSGNLVFEAPNELTVGLADKIKRKILHEFGFSVPVAVKTVAELRHIVQNNPFAKNPAIDTSKLHVTFLSAPPPKSALQELLPLAVDPEQIQIIEKEIYLYCPNGYGRTKLSNNAIEKKLAVEATTRNWNTVNTLLEMAQ